MKNQFVLTLEVDDVNLVLSGLLELPAKVSLSAIQKIQTQVSEQAALMQQTEGKENV